MSKSRLGKWREFCHPITEQSNEKPNAYNFRHSTETAQIASAKPNYEESNQTKEYFWLLLRYEIKKTISRCCMCGSVGNVPNYFANLSRDLLSALFTLWQARTREANFPLVFFFDLSLAPNMLKAGTGYIHCSLPNKLPVVGNFVCKYGKPACLFLTICN